MRIQCPRCQELSEVHRFTTATDPPRMVLSCSACGEEVRADRDGTDGLWNLWDRVTDDFSDASRHEAFIAACEVAGHLPYAAARYREWAESHPEDARAQDRLGRIATLAEVKVLLAQDRRHREKDPLRQVLVVGLVMLLILAVVVMTAPWVFRGVGHGAGERPGSGRPAGIAPGSEPQLQNLRQPEAPAARRPGLRLPGVSPPASEQGPKGPDAGALSPKGQ